MSNGDRSTAWIVGCSIAGLLGVVVCGGGLAATFWFSMKQAVNVAQTAQAEMQDQIRATGFASAWVPPRTDAAAGEMVAGAIEAWRLVDQEATTELIDLGIERDGERGAYQSGATVMDVYAFQVPEAEQSELFAQAADGIDQFNFSTNYSLDDGISHRMAISYSPPSHHGQLWWCKGWLFVFLTEDDALDLESFRETYLTTIAGAERSALEEVGAAPLGAGSAGAVEQLE